MIVPVKEMVLKPQMDADRRRIHRKLMNTLKIHSALVEVWLTCALPDSPTAVHRRLQSALRLRLRFRDTRQNIVGFVGCFTGLSHSR
jgi:hypothetical protein